MRARLAVAYAGQRVELREVILRDKPDAFLATSPTATVPCLDTGHHVLDESRDIMTWALEHHDPDGWLDMPAHGFDLITENDGPFKTALDRYKFASRFVGVDHIEERTKASQFIWTLDELLNGSHWLFGQSPRLVDMAVLPFVRQFAHVDLEWFSAQSWTNTCRWLEAFKTSRQFADVMAKYPQWKPGNPAIHFP